MPSLHPALGAETSCLQLSDGYDPCWRFHLFKMTTLAQLPPSIRRGFWSHRATVRTMQAALTMPSCPLRAPGHSTGLHYIKIQDTADYPVTSDPSGDTLPMSIRNTGSPGSIGNNSKTTRSSTGMHTYTTTWEELYARDSGRHGVARQSRLPPPTEIPQGVLEDNLVRYLVGTKQIMGRQQTSCHPI
ncbi:hypothetical protein OBBRIDRAFT_829814, partial [Obba rivulosa]